MGCVICEYITASATVRKDTKPINQLGALVCCDIAPENIPVNYQPIAGIPVILYRVNGCGSVCFHQLHAYLIGNFSIHPSINRELSRERCSRFFIAVETAGS